MDERVTPIFCMPGRAVGVALVAMLHCCACRQASDLPVSAPKPNVLLVTFDTTRADYLSCYGRKESSTPGLDRLARDGVVFDSCYTPAPITLPAHATLLTGLYPFEHKLRDNGAGVLDEKAVTLAEALKASGYQTAAVVGAYVLHSRYGLAQGFEFYSDEFAGPRARMNDGEEFAERRAEAVNDEALSWIDRTGSQPFFLWAHYFDPHAPYEAPTAQTGLTLHESYAAEVSYADAQFELLRQKVEQRSRAGGREVLIVVAGDHGESLTEHGESTHGFFAYNATLRVPLLVSGPAIPRGRRIPTPVTLADVYPSILRWLNIDPPYELVGRPLPLEQDPSVSTRPLYFETYLPFHMYGWSPLEGVIIDHHKFIAAPSPELYDLKSDPQELQNIASSARDRAAEMSQMLFAAKNAPSNVPRLSSGQQETDAASLRKLQSLGYVAGASTPGNPLEKKLPDPKEMMDVRERLIEVEGQLARGAPAAPALLAAVLERDPNNTKALNLLVQHVSRPIYEAALTKLIRARFEKALPPPFDVSLPSALALALCRNQKVEEGMKLIDRAKSVDLQSPHVHEALSGCLWAAGRYEDAVALWQGVLNQNPDSVAALTGLGDLIAREGDSSRAVDFYARAVRHDSTDPQLHWKLGRALRAAGSTPEAIEHLKRALNLAPQLIPIHSELASVLLEQGRAAEAIEHFSSFAAANPASATARYDLGVALIQAAREPEAAQQFREALSLDPKLGDAWINLGIALFRQGLVSEGKEALQEAAKIEASAGAAYYNLAIAAAKAGDRTEQVRYYQQAVASRPASLPAVEELAAYLIRQRDLAGAVRVLRTGLEAYPENLKLQNSLAWFLCTAPEDTVRNGAEALRLADSAARQTQHRRPEILSTLAAAYAETGDFASAIATVENALSLVGQPQSPLGTKLSDQLQSFRAGKPYRLRETEN